MAKYKQSGHVYEHRKIVENILGYSLPSEVQIHHVDGNGKNNKHSNLVVCPNQKYHALLHARTKVVENGGDPNVHKWCSYHQELHPKRAFSFRKSSYDGLHNNCRQATNEYRKAKGLNSNKFDWRARLHQQYRRAKSGYKKGVEISWL